MITRIQIKKFRSIDNMTIDFGKLTTFVGPNDAGKSNIVRALNLFFNGETDVGVPFDFSRDYRHEEKSGNSKKAREVSIEITFQLPPNFSAKGKEFATWKKVWRRDGFIPEKTVMRYADKSDFGGRSKIPTHLQRHHVHYAPAIKDKRFFESLQGDMYDNLSGRGVGETSTYNHQFNQTLQGSTKPFAKGLKQALREDFTITLPDNLRRIFEAIEIKNAKGIPLDGCGDGIKIRHIPEAFDFLSNLTKGSHEKSGQVRPSFIWIFEEPENNLHIDAAFGMRDRLEYILKKRGDVQLVFTTHSPVFYEMELGGEQSTTNRYWVAQNDEESTSKTLITADNLDELDEQMGMFRLVTEKISAIKKELDEMKKYAQDLQDEGFDFSKPTIFVEGKTDYSVFNKSLEVFFPQLLDKVQIKTAQEGCADSVTNSLIAWSMEQKNKHADNRVKCVGIFDDDEASDKAINAYRQAEAIYFKKSEHRLSVCQKIQTPKTLRDFFQRGYKIPKCLESLYPDELIGHVKGQHDQSGGNANWLERLDDLDIAHNRLPKSIGNKACSAEESVDSVLDADDDLTEADKVRLCYNFTQKGKGRAAEYLSTLSDDEAAEHLKNVRVELQLALEKLGVIPPQDANDTLI